MNRILKIFLLILLIPLYWGIEAGCAGLGGGSGLPGNNFNGATTGDQTPGGDNYRPTAQPTTTAVPMPSGGSFYIFLKFNSPADTDSMISQCSPFIASAYEDGKIRNSLLALNDSPFRPGVNETVEPPPPPPPCNCDGNSGCCLNCQLKPVGSDCQNAAHHPGKCTKDAACVPPPLIRGTIVVYHSGSKLNAIEANYPKTNFEIDPCTLGRGKFIRFGYNGAFGCEASVDFGAEITDPQTGERTYVTDRLQGKCPMRNGEKICMVDLNLKQGSQAEIKTLTCNYVDEPQTADLNLSENTTPSAPVLQQ